MNSLKSNLSEIFRAKSNNEFVVFADLFKQKKTEIRPDGVKGIGIQLSKALMRAGMYHASWVLEIMADKNLMGRVLTKRQFSDELREYTGFTSKAIRVAFDELRGIDNTGYVRKGTYKQRVIENRKRVIELLPKFSQAYITKYRTNLGKKSGKGRPSVLVYIPTEIELTILLTQANLLHDREWGHVENYTIKPFAIMSNISDYKAFIVTDRVARDGKGEYSRDELAQPCGVSPSSVRDYALRLGYKVDRNPPSLEPINTKDISRMPVDEAALKIEIADNRLPKGVHIRDGQNKMFIYTQAGASLALEKSNSIFKAMYVKSTYTPTDKRTFIQ